MSDWQPGDPYGVCATLLRGGEDPRRAGKSVRDGQPVLPRGAVVPRVLAADEPEPPRPWVVVPHNLNETLDGDCPAMDSSAWAWDAVLAAYGTTLLVYVLHAPDGVE